LDGREVARDYEESSGEDEGDWESILSQPAYFEAVYVEVWELTLFREFSFP
jgi:hypothetical protein